MLPVTAAASLTGMVVSWPSFTDLGLPESHTAKNAPALIERLLEQRIIVTTEALGKPATPTCAPLPRQAAGCDYWQGTVSISIREVINMVRAWLKASYLVRRWPMSRILERARSRSGNPGADPTEALRLTAIFNRLRPVFYKSADACFFNSMVLAEFLHAYGIHPRWVFGVQSDPWAAHCWLQTGIVALNDRNEEAQGLSLIMVV